MTCDLDGTHGELIIVAVCEIIKLRDLPGVADIERSLHIANAWAKENDDLQERIDAVSLRLFGITEADTDFNDYPEYPYTDMEWQRAVERANEWNLHFAFMEWEYSDVAPLWAAAGWDVTDGQGTELRAVEYFAAQIMAVLKNLLPQAKFYPAGDGPTRRTLSNAEAANEAEEWGAALMQAAKKFQPTR